MKENKTKNISAYFTEKEHAAIKAIADNLDMSVYALVRRLLLKEVKRAARQNKV